jgi:hypothetical protein
MRNDYTQLDDRTIASTGIGTSPEAVALFSDLQQAAYADGPADTAAAQAVAEQGVAAAATAQGAADTANATASSAQAAADAAQLRADDAYELADGKVTKDAGPTFAAPTATPSRAALPTYAGGTAAATYTQADVQALIDQVAALTSRVAALITDLRGNHALTP